MGGDGNHQEVRGPGADSAGWGGRVQRQTEREAGGEGTPRLEPWALPRPRVGTAPVSEPELVRNSVGEKCYLLPLPRASFSFIFNCCISLASIVSHAVLEALQLVSEFSEVESGASLSRWPGVAAGGGARLRFLCVFLLLSPTPDNASHTVSD